MLKQERKHRIKANLYPNLLTEDPNDYLAKVISERALTVKEVCLSAVNRGGAPTSIEAMELNTNLFLKEMGYLLGDGYSINTGYFVACTVIKGVFKGTLDTFDPKRHWLYFQFGQGDTMRKLLPDVEIQIQGVGNSKPFIANVYDVKAASENDKLTPGHNLKIAGSKIKLAGEHAKVGVYFVSADDAKKRVRVSDHDLIVNNPRELIVMLPALDPDSYRLEIVTQFNGSSILKEPRTAVFEGVLTVD